MHMNYAEQIAAGMNLQAWQVENTLKLFAQNATIPFISRYRKEMTGSLDEIQIGDIREQHNRLAELDKRREAILKSVEEQGFMTEDLRKKIESAPTLADLEDLYLPFRPKKKTRASIARDKGLEPLARQIFRQSLQDPELVAEKYLTDQVETVDIALQGARDIIAEWINEDQRAVPGQSRHGAGGSFFRDCIPLSL